MNKKTIELDCEPRKSVVMKTKKFNIFNFMLCRYCKDSDSIASPPNIRTTSGLHKDSNYMKNNVVNIHKINTYDAKSIDKKSLMNMKSLSGLEYSDAEEGYPENEMFFLRKGEKLILARISSLNFQRRLKLRQASKSVTQKHNESKSESFKLLDMISVFSDTMCEHLSKKFKDVENLLCLDVKTSIQVKLMVISSLIFFSAGS